MWEMILHPFAVAIAWVWVKIHDFLVLIGMGSGSGIAWVLSIVLVTIAVRVIIIPLFLKQIRASRGMQAMQPDLQKIQAKYKGKTDAASRQRMAEETQALYKKHGASPFASCLPLLVQMPVLFAMYRAIFAIKDLSTGTYSYGGNQTDHLGPIDQAMATEIDQSQVLGVPLSSTITSGVNTAGILAFVVLIVAMVLLQFYSIRLNFTKNMPPNADPNNPLVRSQKSMMYMMPAMFIVTGFFFQMGLLVYMVTSAAWALAQSLWTIKVMPTPGSPAYEHLVSTRQRNYQSWAKEYFQDLDARRAEVADDPAATEALVSSSLAEVMKRAKSARIASDFPTSMSHGEKLTIYRNLAMQPWTTLPDEFWMRGVKRHTEAAQERREQQARREQPRRLTKEQRKKQAERREQASQGAVGSQGAAGLSPEEIERRRQERRKARREQARKQGGKR